MWILVCLVSSCASVETVPPSEAGALVLVGGGRTPREAVRSALELAGGFDARVLILPWASSSEKRGVGSVEMYHELGATNVHSVDDLEAENLREAILAADLIWMPGGSQLRLMNELRVRELIAPLRAAHDRGCVVGGTSAGLAVATAQMIAGAPTDSGVRTGISKLETGLGLLSGAIVDQHFTERKRQSRLLSAVLEHPSNLGIGVSERTAIIVEGGSLRVLGDSVVIVYDAREALIESSLEPGTSLGALNLRMHVLRDGMSLLLR